MHTSSQKDSQTEPIRSKPMILDLSENNTVTSWDTIKKDYAGVILRCAYRGYRYNNIKEDKRFKEYAKACNENKIPLGIYFMSQAINEAEAIEEAKYTLNAAIDFGATLPLFIDSEWSHSPHDGRADFLTREERTKVVQAFCDTINENGFVGGVYASESWYTEHLIYNDVKKYYVWVAKYAKNDTGELSTSIKLPKYDLFQFTSKRKVEGIAKPVDCSVYPSEIPAPTPKTDRTISGMPILRKGSRGKAVQIWQIIVDAQPDGIFGDITQQRTIHFQTVHGIQIDGIVGNESWNTGINSI